MDDLDIWEVEWRRLMGWSGAQRARRVTVLVLSVAYGRSSGGGVGVLDVNGIEAPLVITHVLTCWTLV